MRFPAIALPVILAVAGAGYFFAKPKESTPKYQVLEHEPERRDERSADADDALIIARAIKSRDLTEAQSAAMVTAAGRRFMRRKLAWMEAKSLPPGKTTPEQIDVLKHDMESARRVYDLTESLGRTGRLLSNSARADVEMERLLARGSGLSALAERHIGYNEMSDALIDDVEKAFQKQFGKPLPVSARGASAVHRSLGFDHTGRVDVAVSPGGAEGLWLRRYLISKGISFFAFRRAAAGQSTGAHIHIGPASGHAR